MERNITLTRQDEEARPISTTIGEAVIGKALIGNCTDKSISREHGLLRLSDKGDVVLMPLKKMYYIPRGQAKRLVVGRGSAVTLQSGDRFAFLPQRFCFQINIPEHMQRKQGKRKVNSLLMGESIVKGHLSKDDVAPGTSKKIRTSTNESVENTNPRSSSYDDNEKEMNEQQISCENSDEESMNNTKPRSSDDENEQERDEQQTMRENEHKSDTIVNIIQSEPYDSENTCLSYRRSSKENNSTSEEEDHYYED